MTSTPTNSAAALRRASVLCDLRRWDEAIGQVRAVLAMEPHNEDGMRLMARAHLGKDDASEALRWSLAAISQNPEDEWAHRMAALANQRLGRHEEARSMAREAVRLAPLTWQCHHVLAQVLASAGSGLPQARAAADRAVELAPNEALAHLAVGQVAAADGRVEDAKVAFSRALALDPNHSAAHNELGRLNLKMSFARMEGFRSGTSGLADAAGVFATAVRADPRAAVSRRNLDLVLGVAFQRQARAVLLIAWIALLAERSSDSSVARVVPTMLLALPAFSVLVFAVSVPRELRSYSRGFLLRLPLAVAFVGDVIAAILLVAGASFPRATSAAFAGAVVAAILARAVTWQRISSQLRWQNRQRFSRVAAVVSVVSADLFLLGFALLIALGFESGSTPNAGPPQLASAAVLLLMAVSLAARKASDRRSAG